MHAVFGLRSIDRMPLGDVSGVIHDLVTFHRKWMFATPIGSTEGHSPWTRASSARCWGGVRLDTPEVSDYIAAYLRENQQETDGGAVI